MKFEEIDNLISFFPSFIVLTFSFILLYIFLWVYPTVNREKLFVSTKIFTFVLIFFDIFIVSLKNFISKTEYDEEVFEHFFKYRISFYYCIIVIIQMFISIESYYRVKDPTKRLREIVYKRFNYNYPIIFLALLLTECGVVYLTNHYLNNVLNDVYMVPYYCIIQFYLIISVGFYTLILRQIGITKYSKFKKKIIFQLVISCIYLIYFFYYIIDNSFFVTEKTYFSINRWMIFKYLLFFIIFIDLIFNFVILYKSSFYSYFLSQYGLCNCFLEFIMFFCPNDTSFLSLSAIDSSTDTETCFSGVEEDNKFEIMLAKIIHNKFIIEDYLFSQFNSLLNISLASIILLIKKTRKDNSINKTTEEEEIFFSFESLISNKGLLVSDHLCFSNQDFAEFSGLTEKENDTFNLTIKSYYKNQIKSIIPNYKDKLKQLKKSLLLQFDNHNWNSLLYLNEKDDKLGKLKTLSLNTIDNIFSIHILISSEINENDPKNKLNKMITEYLSYLNKTKINKSRSFLPFIIGIYKVNIYPYDEITIIITNNPIVESSPEMIYNYWKLVKVNFPKGNKQILTNTSKRFNSLMTDEFLFESTSYNDKSSETFNNKIFYVENLNILKNILQNDLDFLREINKSSFDLVIIYYEFGTVNGNNTITEKPINEEFTDIDSSFITINSDLYKNYDNSKNGFESYYNNIKCRWNFQFDPCFDINTFYISSCLNNKEEYTNFLNQIVSKFEPREKFISSN